MVDKKAAAPAIGPREHEELMKRLSAQRRIDQIRRARHGLLRRSQINHARHTKSGKLIALVAEQAFIEPKTVRLRSKRGEEIVSVTGGSRPVPAILSLQKNFDETASFLSNLREAFIDGFNPNRIPKSSQHRKMLENSSKTLQYYWDFSTVEEISAPVALMLASEYDCYQKVGGILPGAVDIDSWKSEVRATLEGVGFLDMVGVTEVGPAFIEGDRWKILRFRSGSEADGEQVENLLNDLGVEAALDNPELYGAILEALVNTRHHAYPAGHHFPQPYYPGWWLTGFVDQSKRHIRISVFDRGLSIPGTLTTWDKYNTFERLWRKAFSASPDPTDRSRDGSAIALAMEAGRSSTGEGYRGKGLPSMEEALDLCLDGCLTIYSRNGEYRRWKGKGPHHVNRAGAVGGTLVTWDLRF